MQNSLVHKLHCVEDHRRNYWNRTKYRIEADDQPVSQNETPAWVQEVIQRMQQVVKRQDAQLQQQSIKIQDLKQQLQQQPACTEGLAPLLEGEVPMITLIIDRPGSSSPLPIY